MGWLCGLAAERSPVSRWETLTASSTLAVRAGARRSSSSTLANDADPPKSGAFGPGHNSFFQSPDGKEDWILYHANPEAGQGCGNRRSPRAQRFTWKPDGTPDFGRPVALGVPIPAPAN